MLLQYSAVRIKPVDETEEKYMCEIAVVMEHKNSRFGKSI
jgi:hypothetical protein